MSIIKLTCCLKLSALEALLAKIRSPETRRSSLWIADISVKGRKEIQRSNTLPEK